jgi:hypothetical protein
MTEPTVTLREVFELPENGQSDPEPDRWQAIQDRIAKEAKDVKLPARMHDLGPKICELFDVPLPNILVTSWKKVGNLQTMLEKSRNSPEEIMYLALAEHSINCEQKPYIEMKFKDLPVKKIEFLVKLLFKLKGFVLKIQNGTILQMQTGACEVQGTISYCGQVILEKKLSPINLPGQIELAALMGALEPKPVATAQTA